MSTKYQTYVLQIVPKDIKVHCNTYCSLVQVEEIV